MNIAFPIDFRDITNDEILESVHNGLLVWLRRTENPIFRYIEDQGLKWSFDSMPDTIVVEDVSDEHRVAIALAQTNELIYDIISKELYGGSLPRAPAQ